MQIDFTTTSCCRSDLLYKTYKSFVDNFEGVDFKSSTLFLNLDYYNGIGDIEKSIDVAKSFFGSVVYNINRQPNFAKAIKWLWGQKFNTPYVFHLEEDWELISKIKIADMIDIFDSNTSIVSVKLRHKKRYAEGIDERIQLLPSLYIKDFLQISNFIKETSNPERSINRPDRGSRIKIKNKLGLEITYAYVFTGQDIKIGDKARSIVVDIGREWKSHMGYALKSRGINWNKRNG